MASLRGLLPNHLLSLLSRATLGALGLVLWAMAPQAYAQPGFSAAELFIEGQHREHGTRGYVKDINQAVTLYCEAARLGNVAAQFRLGWLYAVGGSLERNDSNAAYFLNLAAQQGHPQASRLLSQVGQASGPQPRCLFDTEGQEIIATATPPQLPFLRIIQRLAPHYGIHPRLAIAFMRTESNFDPKAISPKNAQGLMQLIPETAERFNVKRPFDPEQNIRGGLAYLRWLLAYFKGNVQLAAAAYNAGEGMVNRYGGIPPFRETQTYVAKILQIYPREQHPFDASVTPASPALLQQL